MIRGVALRRYCTISTSGTTHSLPKYRHTLPGLLLPFLAITLFLHNPYFVALHVFPVSFLQIFPNWESFYASKWYTALKSLLSSMVWISALTINIWLLFAEPAIKLCILYKNLSHSYDSTGTPSSRLIFSIQKLLNPSPMPSVA